VLSGAPEKKIGAMESTQNTLVNKLVNPGEYPETPPTLTPEQAQTIFVPGATTETINTAVENL